MPEHDDRDKHHSSAPSWREIMRKLDIRPSKARGQNFLHDANVVRRIAKGAKITDDSVVLEIGPGLGILTRELASRAREVVSIEIDRRLAEYNQSSQAENVRVVHGDALAIDIAELIPDSQYSLVANLPYSVATAIIQHVFESDPPPVRAVFMVQLEVARRIVARPPEMSILSVAVQFYGNPSILFKVGRGAFIPPPNVDSAVILLETHESPLLPRSEHSSFFSLVRAGFAQRRKRLDNSIASALGLNKSDVSLLIDAAGCDPSTRAERLDVPDWLRLYDAMRDRLGDA